MSRKPIGERPMTDAERQTRCRAARAADRPISRFRRPADHRSRAKRWRDTVDELVQLQAEYQAWFDALPETLQDTATAEERWSPIFGQVVKLGSPFEGRTHGGEAEALFG